MNATVKTIVFWVVIAVSALLLWQVVRSSPTEQRASQISYSQFLSAVDAGAIARVDIARNRIRGQYRDGNKAFWLIGPSDPGVFLDRLRDKGVEIWFRDSEGGFLPSQLLGTWAPLILLAALWFFMIRQMRSKSGNLGDEARPGGPGPLTDGGGKAQWRQ